MVGLPLFERLLPSGHSTVPYGALVFLLLPSGDEDYFLRFAPSRPAPSSRVAVPSMHYHLLDRFLLN
jgi:hypothetical protein